MSNRTPTEIVYVESGLTQLKCQIYKRQYTFWKKILTEIELDCNTSIAKLYNLAISKNLHYLRHYQNLLKDFPTANACYEYHFNDFCIKNKESITRKTAVERNSILNDYVKLNESLISPTFYRQYYKNMIDMID